MADWSEKLDDFIARHSEDYAQKRVDYLGVNLGGEEPLVKLYYKDDYTRTLSEGRPSSLLGLLRERDMIRFLTLAEDTGGRRRYRYDISLKRRTNENMEALFVWLRDHFGIFSRRESEIRTLAAMPICDARAFPLAGMHFLGFVSEDDRVTALKYHYLCRRHKDVSTPSRLGRYDSGYFLTWLAQSGIPAIERLCPLVRDVLGCCGGHVCMVGTHY